MNTMAATKKTKQQNPFKLGAAVALFRPGSGVERLGQIVKITKSLLTVKWEDGSTELFGRAGQEFYGNADESGEALKPRGDKQIWGTDEDSHLTIPTEHAKQSLAEKRKKSAELRVERREEQARRESDPIYQKRQADLNRYAEALQGIGTVENSWSNQTNFRIELENIPPAQMEDLISAISKIRKRQT
jgi:hypothetical protein